MRIHSGRGAVWFSALDWGSRGRRFKSCRPDFFACRRKNRVPTHRDGPLSTFYFQRFADVAFTFEKLIVYQKAIAFADAACSAAEAFPRGYGFLSDQLNRAAVSICTHIAEGNGQLYQMQFFRHLATAVVATGIKLANPHRAFWKTGNNIQFTTQGRDNPS